jgi:hypothetical protein
MQKKRSIFWSKGFILGLLLLLVNDHLLKAEFHNEITGKLSDLAGLFIFPLFFSALFPAYKKHIYWLTALIFTWWKLPLSNGAIEWFNHLSFLQISRVVDYTDLLALAVLPFSYWYLHAEKKPLFVFHPLPVIMLASVGFIATSRSPMAEVEYNKEYSFQYPIDTLKKKIFFHPAITNISDADRNEYVRLDAMKRDTMFELSKPATRKKKLIDEYTDGFIYAQLEDSGQDCFHLAARISLIQNREISKLKLLSIQYRHCNHNGTQGGKAEDKALLQDIFEKLIIQPLHE